MPPSWTSRTLLLLLLAASSGCDDGPACPAELDSGGEAATSQGSSEGSSEGDESGGAEGSEEEPLACQLASPPASEPIAEAATCRHVQTGLALAACQGESELHRRCDSEFGAWCVAQDGLMVLADIAHEPVVDAGCGIGAGGPACAIGFFAACEERGGVATCDDPSECVSARCSMPKPAILAWCCAAIIDAAGSGCVVAEGECPGDRPPLECGQGEACQRIGSEYECVCL